MPHDQASGLPDQGAGIPSRSERAHPVPLRTVVVRRGLPWQTLTSGRLEQFKLVVIVLMLLIAIPLFKSLLTTSSPSVTTTPLLEKAPKLETKLEAGTVRFTLRNAETKPFPSGLEWRAVLFTPAGPVEAHGMTKNSDRATLEVPQVRAGLITYRVEIAGHRLNGRLERLAGSPVTPLRLKVGARSVRVVGNRRPALVLHPLDRDGNVSSEPVTVRVRRPDGRDWRKRIAVKHLTAWAVLPPGTRTGSMQVSAASGEARGERAEVDVVPGPVAGVRFEVSPKNVPADQREHWLVRVDGARDALGNPALDGTVTEFGTEFGSSGDWHLFATRPIVRAGAQLEVPPVVSPGAYSLEARSDGMKVPAVRVRAETPSLASTVPLRFEAGNKARVVVGPVQDRFGALLDNGTPVTLEVWSDRLEYSVTEPLDAGKLVWIPPPLPKTVRSVRVQVAGQTFTLPIPNAQTRGQPLP
jgi:hypothetical protein